MKTEENTKWWVGAGAVVVVALAVVLWRLQPGAKEPPDAADGDEPDAREERAARRPSARRPSVRPAPAKEEDDAETVETEEPDGDEKPEETPQTEEEMRADAEEKLVDAFDDMTDKWREPAESDVPMEEVEKFRQQFNKIPQDRKEECLQRALNLLPDDNIMLLAGILLDKEQPEEFLELVYNDILNRDESVKKPLLLEIYKDKEHPCWSNTAWILDATGETPGK